MAQLVKDPPAMPRDPGSIPGWGRSPGEGKGCPLQYSGLENSTVQSLGSKESDTAERLALTVISSPGSAI